MAYTMLDMNGNYTIRYECEWQLYNARYEWQLYNAITILDMNGNYTILDMNGNYTILAYEWLIQY